MRHLLTILVPALLVAGCSTSPPAQQVAAAAPAAAAAEEQTCARESQTHSAILVTRCRTKAQIEADKAAARQTTDAVRSAPRNPSNPFPGN